MSLVQTPTPSLGFAACLSKRSALPLCSAKNLGGQVLQFLVPYLVEGTLRELHHLVAVGPGVDTQVSQRFGKPVHNW